MTDLTPEMTEKAKKAKSAELSDDMLGNVAGGVEMLRRGDPPSAKPSNNVTNELSDDELDNVAGGEKTFQTVPALRQCPNCGALYPMDGLCPNCTAISKHEAQE